MNHNIDQKVLVTGGSGFIGSTLIEELTRAGLQVRALLRGTSSTENLKGLSFERVQGSLSDFESLKRAVEGVDYVFHLAGAISAPERATYFEINAEGTRRLAQAVAEVRPGLKRFVHVSSLAAGGPVKTLRARVEMDTDEPVSTYGESKLKSEGELLQYKDQFPVTIVRPPMVYGPKDKATFVFVRTVGRNLLPLFRGKGKDGQKYYSAIHSEDLCRGIFLASQVSPDVVPSGEIFYLSGDDWVSYENLMFTIARHLGKKPFRFSVPMAALTVGALGLSALGRVTKRTFPLNLDKLNEIRPDYWVCSNEKAKRVLGFAPRFDISSGLLDSVQWYRRAGWIV